MGIRSLSSASVSTGAKRSKAWDQSTVLSNFESIATVLVGAGGASSVTLSSIPSNYTHLQIRASNRDTRTGTNQQSVQMRFNGDTGNNYSRHFVEGYGGGTQSAGGTASTDWIKVGLSPTSSATASTYGAMIIDIFNYSNTSKYKTARSTGGDDLNGEGTIGLWGGLWMNTTAISSITFTPTNGESWVVNSRFALYGIRS
jgi:hypothetical protein